MRFGAGTRVVVASGVVSSILVLTLLERLAPGLAADPPLVEPALDSAVRLEISLQWPDRFADSEFTGSGWTRKCQPVGAAFEVVLATAGHVVDVPALEDEARPGPHPPATVKVVVIYRDGRQYTAGREAIRVDRVHDYGEVQLSSPVARRVLPTGGAAEVRPGSHVFAVASPGLLSFALFEGTVSTIDARFVKGVPEGAWLSSMPVAPGASGAPVVTDQGQVVAFVDGFVEWSVFGSLSVLVTLPPTIQKEETYVEQSPALASFVGVTALSLVIAGIIHRLRCLSVYLMNSLKGRALDRMLGGGQT